ncbi:MAG: hypothetical protein P8Y70_00205 [Candidatus Lokiarchaeota archaeon]
MDFVPSGSKKQEWKEQIEYCKNNLYKLEEWEIGFIDNMDERFNKFGVLTFKESNLLRKIFYKIS